MPRDLLAELAESAVPPPPPTFERSLHERLNQRLVVHQVLDLILKGSGYTIWHLACGLVGLLRLTITGKFEPDPKPGAGSAPDA